MASSYELAAELLHQADIEINGSRPWDLQLHDSSALNRALAYGNLGLGEAYMDQQWEAEALDQFFARLLSADIHRQISPARLLWHGLKNRWFNLQTRRRAWEVGERHYDVGNDFYAAMLDPRMVYTCGYWRGAQNLTEAQLHKLELSCRKLQLQPGMRVLDIGCGWGSLARYAAEQYGVAVVGLTVSREQADYAREQCQQLPVDIRLQDYREVNEPFDRVVSLGMFEHVGPKNHSTFMSVVDRCLQPGGLFLLHTIGRNMGQTMPDPFIAKYIFPNGELPAVRHIASAVEGRFVVEDLHNFGADYDHTLMAWHDNFTAHWHQFADQYGERFFRMWRYYLLSCAGAFRSRDIQLWQWVFSKGGVPGGYQRPEISQSATP